MGLIPMVTIFFDEWRQLLRMCLLHLSMVKFYKRGFSANDSFRHMQPLQGSGPRWKIQVEGVQDCSVLSTIVSW